MSVGDPLPATQHGLDNQIVNVREDFIKLWDRNGGDWWKWNHDAKTGLIRGKQDPNFRLGNSGQFADGANLMLWTCAGNSDQRFTVDAAQGSIGMRSYPWEVMDAYGTGNGATVGIRHNRGGQNQQWSFVL